MVLNSHYSKDQEMKKYTSESMFSETGNMSVLYGRCLFFSCLTARGASVGD
ncbi:hypothetical protein MKW92_017455, partial [Papaver armeniacum]